MEKEWSLVFLDYEMDSVVDIEKSVVYPTVSRNQSTKIKDHLLSNHREVTYLVCL